MSEYHDLVESLAWLLTHRLQARSEYTHGILGNGQGHVEVPNRPDYTYVRPDRFSDRVYEVFNKRVSGVDGTPVLIGEMPWQPGLTQVVAVDWDAYRDVGWGDATPGLPAHGRSHEWLDGAPGFDTFNVYRRQIGELKTHPIGSGSPSVYVSAYNFTHMEHVKSWPGLPGLDLTNAMPATTGSARLALVYWDPCSGTTGMLGVATGTIDVDSPAVALNRPPAPAGTIPSAWVRLAGGQNDITEFDIYDARPLWMPTLEFATGSCGIWAGIIPIGDPGDHFTGSTVESALEEIVDMGGGPPSGPAGGDLTGTYPNPIVDGLLTRPLGLNPVAEGYVLMWTGSAWQPHPQTAQVPTGPAGGDLTGTYPDPLVAGLYGSPLLPVVPGEGDVLMFTGSVWRPIAHNVVSGVTKTVGPAGDFPTVQGAIDWFADGRIIKGACKISVATGTVYAEALVITGLMAAEGDVLEIEGDTRWFVGASWVDSAPVTCQDASAGSGVVTLAGAAAQKRITVTGAGGNPDFTGLVSGDKVLVVDNAGTLTEYTVNQIDPGGAGSHVIEMTANLTSAVGNTGTSITIQPNVAIQAPAGADAVTVSYNKGILLDGLYLDATAGAAGSGLVVSELGQCALENVVMRGDNHGVIASFGGLVSGCDNGDVAAIGCGIHGIFCIRGGMATLPYAVSLSNTSYGFHAQFWALINANDGVAANNVTGFRASYFGVIVANNGYSLANSSYGFSAERFGGAYVYLSRTARSNGVADYYAAQNSYMFAVSTNVGGPTYSPAASDTEGNVYAIITFS